MTTERSDGGIALKRYVMKYIIHEGEKYYRASDVKEITLFLGETVTKALSKNEKRTSTKNLRTRQTNGR
jgi:hypothetical protein